MINRKLEGDINQVFSLYCSYFIASSGIYGDLFEKRDFENGHQV